MDGSAAPRTEKFFTVLLTMSSTESYFSNRSNLAIASGNRAATRNFVVLWESCLFVDEHFLDAALWLFSESGYLAVATVPGRHLPVVCFTKNMFDH